MFYFSIFLSVCICVKRFFSVKKMGAIGRHDTPVKTSELTDWICKVRVKKRNYKRKNLFIDAVLTNALVRAEHLLRAKQRERKMKWEEIRTALRTRASLHVQGENLSAENSAAAAICEDLNCIDDFMHKLSQIKVPVQR